MLARYSLLGFWLCLLLVTPAEARQTISATTITTNTTWGTTGTPADTAYLIQNTLTVSNGATLTVQAGTVLYFSSGTSLVIGGSSTAGSLVAIGTDTSPVVFTSDNAQHGGWAGISFADNSDLNGASSQLTYCVIKKGGTSGASGAMVRAASTTGVTLTSSLLADYRNYGMDLSNAPITVNQCVFRDSIGTYPVSGSARDAGSLFANNTFVMDVDGKRNGILLKTGNQTQNATLAAPPSGFCYITAGGDWAVEGSGAPILTIVPGTVIKFPSGARLLIGLNTTGGLSAEGVVFTSALDDTVGDTDGLGASSGAANQWGGLLFGSHPASTAAIDSSVVRYAGTAAGVRALASVTITRCLIEQNTGYGLSVEGSSVTAGNMHDNLIRNNSSYEIAGPAGAMAGLVPHNTIVASADGKRNGYLLYTGNVPASCTLPVPPSGFCYITAGGDWAVENAAGPVLTLLPGTVIKFPGDRLLIGLNTTGGLSAKGVVFTSALDDTVGDTDGLGASSGAANQWGGLLFGSHPASTAAIDSSVVRYAGTAAGVRALASVTITRCLIEQNTGYGLSVEGSSVTAGNMHDNLIRNNSSYEIAGPAGAMAGLVPHNTIVASADGKRNGYLLYTGNVPASCTLPVPPSGFCYITAGGDWAVENAAGPVLTLLPGTVIKFPSGARLLIGWNTTGGLSTDGVLFTSSADDTLGDTAGDGISAGAAGQWRALGFGSHCLSASLLRCSAIRYAGQTDARGVQITSSSPSFQYCQLTGHSGDGIYISGTSANPWMHGCTISGNSDYGVEITSDASPLLEFNDLHGNATGAVRTSSTTVTVKATANWWGSPTGPYDPSAALPDQNAGLGAAVSDYVWYRPWLDAPITPVCPPAAAVPTVVADAVVSCDEVEVFWIGLDPSLSGCVVERLTADQPSWLTVGAPEWSDGALRYVDRDVHAGGRYEYRLTLGGNAGETLGWIAVVLPERPTLALHGPRPNPSHGVPTIALTLADLSPASLRVFDVAGRAVGGADLQGLGAGFHTVPLNPHRPLSPGVYLVQLRQGAVTLTKRLLVVN